MQVDVDVVNGDTPTLIGDGVTISAVIGNPQLHEDDSNEIICKMPKNRSEEICTKFWREMNWREQLCQCEDCMKIYLDQKILFLFDGQDAVQVYEEKGKAKALEQEQSMIEKETKMLNSLDRVPLMETIAAYNDLRTSLSEYLKKFAENKKVVREEDIKEFFEDMAAKKKQKTASSSFLCR